ESIRVESYLDCFPELRQDRAAVAGLIVSEFRLRRQQRSGPTLDEYLRRFPDYRDDLQALAQRETASQTVLDSTPHHVADTPVGQGKDPGVIRLPEAPVIEG